jgi:hypothetical protein
LVLRSVIEEGLFARERGCFNKSHPYYPSRRQAAPAAMCSATASSLLGVFLTPLVAGFFLASHGLDISARSVLGIVVQLLLPFVAFQRKRTEAIGVKAPLPGFVEPALASSRRLKSVRIANRFTAPPVHTGRVCHCAFHVVRYRDLPEALLVPVVD